MRFTQAVTQTLSNESITSQSLIRQMVVTPEMLPTVMTLYRGQETIFASLLADKGLTSRGLYEGLNNNQWRITKSNEVHFAIENDSHRKQRFKNNASGVTFVCDEYPTTPGKNQSVITVYLDGNWFSPKDVLRLKDWNTLLYVCDEQLPQEVAGGCWAYRTKIVTNNEASYVDTTLLAEGCEISFAYTMFEHDWSRTGYEKYTFDGWGKAYMTLQRMKWSASGTAKHMKEGVYWTTHNGNTGYLTYAENQMLKRWAQAQEEALLFGKGTVAVDGRVLMKDMEGREILAGDGLMNQGDGSLKIPYQTMTESFLQSIMGNIALRASSSGKVEAAFLCGQQCYFAFQNLMSKKGIQLVSDKEIEGTGENKGINATYSYYEFAGVRIIPQWYKYFDAPHHAKDYDANGVNKNSFKGMFISLGPDGNGNKGIELIQLRPVTTGTVAGMDVGGSGMATSVDGSSHHIISQCGLVLRNQEGVAEIYKR